MDGKIIGMFLIGAALGIFMPSLPAPLNGFSPYIGIIFLAIGLYFFIKK
ncbi:MAG: hypothetical protein ABH854_00830 [Candidatus Diapherotrites archaeon]|nr:hypothetical protein [Candidatus Micrarchaeota archaeon]